MKCIQANLVANPGITGMLFRWSCASPRMGFREPLVIAECVSSVLETVQTAVCIQQLERLPALRRFQRSCGGCNSARLSSEK